jgi:hypothetical protein
MMVPACMSKKMARMLQLIVEANSFESMGGIFNGLCCPGQV